MQTTAIMHVIVSIKLDDCLTSDCRSSPFFITAANNGSNITENRYDILLPASKSLYALAYIPAWIADMSLGKIRSIKTGSRRL